MGTEGLVHVLLDNKVESLMISVHVEMSLGQNKSKASVVGCSWSKKMCQIVRTLLRESVSTTRGTTRSMPIGGSFESWICAKDLQSQLKAASWLGQVPVNGTRRSLQEAQRPAALAGTADTLRTASAGVSPSHTGAPVRTNIW